MRSMVEGYAVSSAAYGLLCPSTTLRVVPLPRWGRIARRPPPTPKWTIHIRTNLCPFGELPLRL